MAPPESLFNDKANELQNGAHEQLNEQFSTLIYFHSKYELMGKFSLGAALK